jgi:hypothetical protein
MVRDHLIIERGCAGCKCGARASRVVSEMMDVMSYVLSQDGEFVKVDEQGYEYTGMYVVRE